MQALARSGADALAPGAPSALPAASPATPSRLSGSASAAAAAATAAAAAAAAAGDKDKSGGVASQAGLLPRLVRGLFEAVAAANSHTSFEMSCQLVEIYPEGRRDLLQVRPIDDGEGEGGILDYMLHLSTVRWGLTRMFEKGFLRRT